MVEDSVKAVLQMWLGEEEGDKTFNRWYNWLTEIFHRDNKYIDECFKAISDSTNDQMVTIRNIDVNLTCPHHLLPVEMLVHIGYKPKGRVLGVSKFARIAREMAKPPVTQEQYVQSLADLLAKKLDQPFVIVIAIGKHECMRCRGILARQSEMITTAMGDVKDQVLKEEFMRMISKNGN